MAGLQQCLAETVREFYSDEVVLAVNASIYPVSIAADKEYLNMLLHNLMQNAERHGQGKIITQVVAKEKTVELIIEDNGSGIPCGERAHVFKHLSYCRRAKYSGYGVGWQSWSALFGGTGLKYSWHHPNNWGD